MTRVELKQAQQRFMELIERAAGGEEVVIFQDDEPLVKVTAIVKPMPERQFGSARGMIHLVPDFDEPIEDFEEYM
jgi:antitoxin (DNA-binding transcriptional repressor) of toxin-antitoxin stability system